MIRRTAIAVVAVALAQPAFGHHGGGTFDSGREVQYQGTLTRLDFVNPHSWIYFDVTERDGTVSHHRCELRAAQVLRRSGWTPEMFKWPSGSRSVRFETGRGAFSNWPYRSARLPS